LFRRAHAVFAAALLAVALAAGGAEAQPCSVAIVCDAGIGAPVMDISAKCRVEPRSASTRRSRADTPSASFFRAGE